MTSSDQFDPSQVLGDIIFLALDHGVDSVCQGGPLVPFVMAGVEGEHSLNRFMAEPYEKAVAEARGFASRLPPQANVYAVCYDGFVTVDDRKHDAIIVTGAERGKGRAYLLAQRYVPATGSKALEPVGNAAFLGREDSLFEQ